MLNQIKIVNLARGVHDYYRKNVKGNFLNTVELTKRKLTRNILIGENTGKNPEGYMVYKYGQLYITYDESTNTVMKLINIKGQHVQSMIKDNRYHELNKELGIAELEEQIKKEYYEHKKMVNNLKVSEGVFEHWRKLFNSEDSNEIVERKIKKRILKGKKLQQFADQINNGRQFYKYGRLIICVVDNEEVVFIQLKHEIKKSA